MVRFTTTCIVAFFLYWDQMHCSFYTTILLKEYSLVIATSQDGDV